MQSTLDPLCFKKRYGSCLVIGQSSTGKSELLKKACEIFLTRTAFPIKHLYVINDRDNSFGSKAKKLAEFSCLTKVAPDSLIVVEDLIMLKPKEADHLRLTLNYNVHHKSLIVFVVAHHVWKNGVSGMLPFFNTLIFTNCHANAQLIKLCLGSFSLGPDNVDEILGFVKRTAVQPGQYFVFDTRTFSFYFASNFECLLDPEKKLKVVFEVQKDSNEDRKSLKLDAESASPEDNSNELKSMLIRKFEAFVKTQSHREEAISIFGMIASCVPLHLIREFDLTFQFRFSNGAMGRVSLLDYIFCLLDAEAAPSKEISFFHNYLKSLCHLPKMYNRNKYLI